MPNWNHVLNDIKKEKGDGVSSPQDIVRRRYLAQLKDHVKRNIICYYSGFLSKPRTEGVAISDEDKNGFMLCVHKWDKDRGLDILIHTPGGNIAATESLVHYLRQIFGNDIRAFIPQIAMSAGTMLACSCREIFMGKHSNIGPIDPQIGGVAAFAVLAEIELAYKEIASDPKRAAIWNPILSRYTPTFVQLCHWAIERGKAFVGETLKSNMFSDLGPEQRDAVVETILGGLGNLRENKGHDKHIHFDEARALGLKVRELEEDKKLQDLVLTVHHCYMHTLANTGAIKIIENDKGRAYVKVQVDRPGFVLEPMPAGAPVPAQPALPSPKN